MTPLEFSEKVQDIFSEAEKSGMSLDRLIDEIDLLLLGLHERSNAQQN